LDRGRKLKILDLSDQTTRTRKPDGHSYLFMVFSSPRVVVPRERDFLLGYPSTCDLVSRSGVRHVVPHPFCQHASVFPILNLAGTGRKRKSMEELYRVAPSPDLNCVFSCLAQRYLPHVSPLRVASARLQFTFPQLFQSFCKKRWKKA